MMRSCLLWLNLFADLLRFLALERKPFAQEEILGRKRAFRLVGASGVAFLEGRREVIAPAISAAQFVGFRLTTCLLPERPRRLGLSRCGLLPDSLLADRPRRAYLFVLGR